MKIIPLALTSALALAAVSTVSAQTRIAPEALTKHWILTNTSLSADAPNAGENLDKPGCVAVTYTIGSDGKPMNIQVAKVVPKSGLGDVAKSMVANFQYAPSLTNKNGDPVATYIAVPFNAPDDAAKQQLTVPCKLPGYGN